MLESEFIKFTDFIKYLKEVYQIDFDKKENKLLILDLIQNKKLKLIIFYDGDIVRQCFRDDWYRDNLILVKEETIYNVVGYFYPYIESIASIILDDCPFPLFYPVISYRLYGVGLPSITNEERDIQEIDIVEFYLADSLKDEPQLYFSINDFLLRKSEVDVLLKEIVEKEKINTTQTTPTDSQLSQQVADLNAQLEQVRAENERLKSHSNQYRNIGNGALFMFQDEAKKSEQQKATIDQQAKEIERLKAQLASIEQTSEQASKATQSDTVSNDKLLSNVELNNLKKAVIAENNRQIATVLKRLDYLGLLSKDDLLQVIRPNMESMAKVLNGENGYKALLVVDSTIKDNHLKSLSFQTGRKTKEQTEKKSIQLIFDREKPPITEN